MDMVKIGKFIAQCRKEKNLTQAQLAEKFGIMSIPTILLFENNELKQQAVGFKSREELEELINS